MDAVVAGGELQRTVCDGDQSVCVQRVVRRIHRDRAAGDGESERRLQPLCAGRIILVGRGRGRVVHKPAPAEILSVRVRRRRAAAAARRDGQLAARDDHTGLRLQAVLTRRDRDRTAVKTHKARVRLLAVGGFDAVLARRYRNRAARDRDAILAFDPVLHCVHRDRAVGDLELILADDAVLAPRVHRECTRAGDGKVVFAVDRGVRTVGVAILVGRVIRAVGHGVDRSLRQHQHHLFRRLHPERGAALRRDVRAVQHQPHDLVARLIHDDLPVVQRAVHHIGAARRDRHRAAVHAHAGRVTLGRDDRAVEANDRRIRRHRRVRVLGRIPHAVVADLGDRRRGGDARRRTVAAGCLLLCRAPAEQQHAHQQRHAALHIPSVSFHKSSPFRFSVSSMRLAVDRTEEKM